MLRKFFNGLINAQMYNMTFVQQELRRKSARKLRK